MPCKVPNRRYGETRCEKNNTTRRSKYACIVEAHESTRKTIFWKACTRCCGNFLTIFTTVTANTSRCSSTFKDLCHSQVFESVHLLRPWSCVVVLSSWHARTPHGSRLRWKENTLCARARLDIAKCLSWQSSWLARSQLRVQVFVEEYQHEGEAKDIWVAREEREVPRWERGQGQLDNTREGGALLRRSMPD